MRWRHTVMKMRWRKRSGKRIKNKRGVKCKRIRKRWRRRKSRRLRREKGRSQWLSLGISQHSRLRTVTVCETSFYPNESAASLKIRHFRETSDGTWPHVQLSVYRHNFPWKRPPGEPAPGTAEMWNKLKAKLAKESGAV